MCRRLVQHNLQQHMVNVSHTKIQTLHLACLAKLLDDLCWRLKYGQEKRFSCIVTEDLGFGPHAMHNN